MTDKEEDTTPLNVANPDDENTFRLVDFRSEMADRVNMAEYVNTVTYLKRATKAGKRDRIVAAVVPVELVQGYQRLLKERTAAIDAEMQTDAAEATDAVEESS